ncbi:DUF3168 domain-containing protein [Rhodovulum sulfidophilum]|uniref:DUF3168 domain-containing protein n=2 Tax=Rhodovulum sulfidophilum TaxID=35806 RepID=UPI001927A733|nr:DUF3168 domain-containing protein [Rhodovulum sulfidophilum]MBL3587454.1 DUF3168 domain-containing protein [Rhodovulum sulfidophilum]
MTDGMERLLRARLRADPGVAALAGERVNWDAHPQGAPRPALVLHLIAGAPGRTLTGPDGLWTGRIQIDAWARERAGAGALARATIACLNGLSESVIRGLWLDSQRRDRAADPDDRTWLYRVSMDFSATWRER